MESERPDPMTKSYIAELSKKKQLLEIEIAHSIVLFHNQKDKPGKKRTMTFSKTVLPKEPEPKKEKTKKEPKEKPADWVCKGNVVDGTPCPREPEDQEFTSRTLHNKKLHDACKQCKKAIKKLQKE